MIVAHETAELSALEGPLAVTIGVFDGVHRGHQAVFAALRREAEGGGERSVVVTLDPHPLEVLRKEIAPPLLTTPSERCALIERFGGPPDAVLVQRFDRSVAALTPDGFLGLVNPPRARLGTLVIGHDFRMGRDRSGGLEELTVLGRQQGFRVVQVTPSQESGSPVSSSRIRALVAEGALPEAADLLGHPYRVEGRVVTGRGQGRKLNFPTANVELQDSRKLLPAHGVYALRVRLAGEGAARPAVMNWGVRPTYGGGAPTLEVHLLDFSGELVGQTVALELIRRLREEKRFDGPKALAEAIARDVEEARKILRDVN